MPVATDITIEIGSVLRAYCHSVADLSLSATTVGDALAQVERREPALYQSVCDETGAVRRHVGVFVNDANIRDLNGLDSALEPGDVITILPAVSGG